MLRACRPAATVAVALVCAMVLAGCGGSGGGSLPNSLPGSLPSLPSTSRPSSQPTTTETTTEPPTTTTLSQTVTLTPTSTGTPTSENDTPWGWIAVGALLVALLGAAIAWALGRRGAPGREWRATAAQTAADGTAFPDAAPGQLIPAT